MTNEVTAQVTQQVTTIKELSNSEFTPFILILTHLGKCTYVGLSGIYHLLMEQTPNTVFDEYLKKNTSLQIYTLQNVLARIHTLLHSISTKNVNY